jgi:hypothetical protein
MLKEYPPFKVLDEAAIAASDLKHKPYDWTYIEKAIPAEVKEPIIGDLPNIPTKGTYGVPSLRYGPRFQDVLDDLLNPRFRELVEKKFGMDLSHGHPTLVMMGSTSGHYNEGYAHPDSKHKILTVLLGFSREWPYEKGRLRILRSSNRDDFEFEYPPEFGKMLMFRVCDHSWHGFVPQKGQRVSLQFCWVDSRFYVFWTYARHAISGFFKSVPWLKELVVRLPRKSKYKDPDAEKKYKDAGEPKKAA